MPQNDEIQLSRGLMTPTPCRVAGCIIYLLGLRIHARALTYLLTYTVDSGRIKPAKSPKRLKRAKVTINGLYKVVHGFSIAAKMYDLE